MFHTLTDLLNAHLTLRMLGWDSLPRCETCVLLPSLLLRIPHPVVDPWESLIECLTCFVGAGWIRQQAEVSESRGV